MALFHITVTIKSFFMILLLNSPLFCQSKVIKKDNGLTYITGRGCGTLTPIKHFTSMPKDISELTCAIIMPDKVKQSSSTISGQLIFSKNGNVVLTKGDHVWSASDWSDEFKVEYNVIVNKELSVTWTSLFHVTTGKNGGEGGRLPAVFVNRGKFFLISYHVNGKTDYWKKYNYELNKEYHFEISQQTNSKGEAVYSIKINGETFHEIVNTTPLKFKDVKLYLSDPWHGTFEPFGKLSNFKIIRFN